LTASRIPPAPECFTASVRRRRLRLSFATATAALWLTFVGSAFAGGGVVLSNDTCIINIGFYDAHFTAYQPNAKGDTEFCEDLPVTGKTVFVLDYLHRSLKDVPVDFRIIRNVTGVGEFAREKDVNAIADLDAATVFYAPPMIKANGTLLVEHVFAERGEYIGIVTAGHPSNANTYTAVFPFEVGASGVPWGWLGVVVALILAGGFLFRMKHIGGANRSNSQ